MHLADNQPRTSVETAAPVAVGYWSSLIVAVLGIAYAAVIGFLLITGGMTLPPADWVQLFAALVTIASGPLLVGSLAALHYVVPAGRRVFSLLGVLFAVVFMVFVSINRFVQLAVVRVSVARGETGGLERFMPYGSGSAMLALEMAGWGFFLGLALLCAAFALDRRGIEGRVRWSFLLYGVLGLISTAAFVVESPLSMIGFVAWGLVLPIAAVLLAVWFGRMRGGRVG